MRHLLLCALLLSTPVWAVTKWETVEIRISNTTITGIPYDIDLISTWTRPSSGTIDIWGYYDGGNCTEELTKRCEDNDDCLETCENEEWVIEFMCDEVGIWSYVTSSTTRSPVFMSGTHQLNADTDLHGLTGNVTCTAGDHPGMLEPISRRWKFRDSLEHIAPIAYMSKYFIRANTPDGTGPDAEAMTTLVQLMADWGAHFIGTNLLTRDENETLGNTQSQEDRIFVDQSITNNIVIPDTDRFYLPVWDRIEAVYDEFHKHQIGLYIRPYADDDDSPCDTPTSPSECTGDPFLQHDSIDEFRFFRYMVARLSAYPMVIWDLGIDAGEYRSDAEVVEYVTWILANDPWVHPVSSRCCSSGNPAAPANQTHFSDGDSNVPRFSNMITDWNRAKSTFYTDHWREDNQRGGTCVTTSCGSVTDFDSGDNQYLIRLSAWTTLMVPVGAIFSNREPPTASAGTDRYLTEAHYNTFPSASDIGLRTRFMSMIQDYSSITPDAALLTNGSNVLTSSDLGDEFIAYAYKTHSSTFDLDLSTASGALTAYWYDPETGAQTVISDVIGGGNVTFTPPDSSDWALHVTKLTTYTAADTVIWDAYDDALVEGIRLYYSLDGAAYALARDEPCVMDKGAQDCETTFAPTQWIDIPSGGGMIALYVAAYNNNGESTKSNVFLATWTDASGRQVKGVKISGDVVIN